MNIKPFAVEEWMNAYEDGARYNIAETCVDSVSLDELFSLAGEDKQAFLERFCARRLTYGDIVGSEALRKGICGLYKSLGSDEVVPTHGAAGAHYHVFCSLISPGDGVVSIMPAYQQLYSIPEAIGADVWLMHLRQENGYLPDLAELKSLVDENTKLICVNNPNNPTGVVYNEETIRAIAAVLAKKEQEYGHAIYLISDEPYRELVFDGASVPWIPNDYKNTIVAYSFSKSLSLPGDRIGYLALRSEVEDFENIVAAVAVATRITGFINASGLQQLVCARCCDETVDISFYDKNRKRLYDALTAYGYEMPKPEGAFYLFVKTPTENDLEFVEKIKEHRILLTPGSGFGCPGYVRIAYCVAPETIEGALSGFKAMMEYYKNK